MMHFQIQILPIGKETLAGWILGNHHSIVIYKVVYNTLDANVCTMFIAGFEAFMLVLQTLTN